MSLPEQRDAILRYAERTGLEIALWLEEMETAAKRGRPIFNRAMRLLHQRKYQGIILHKLDRGARNLKDWAEIGELSDKGIKVHFVSEGLDLNSRGGRLSADIQAVVASDFIRNLKDEAWKGMEGRLKQGLYPWRAPLGYLDQGKAQLKTIDPVKGPLVRKAFDLYATASFSFKTIAVEMHRLGLRNQNGGRITKNGWSTLLNNPFYIGINKLRKTNQSFRGGHEPLVNKTLFDRVQRVLTGKVNRRSQRHDFIFRRLLSCAVCHCSLIGERQKGHVYYRCHSGHSGSIREEAVEKKISALLQVISFNDKEKEYLRGRVTELRSKWTEEQAHSLQSARMHLGQVKDRLNRLTDAYLDNALDKEMFEQRKTALLMEQKSAEENLETVQKAPGTEKLDKFLELAGTAWLSYRMGTPEEKREMVKIVTSNRTVDGKNLELEPSIPFRDLANRAKVNECDPNRDIPRTFDRILKKLARLSCSGLLPDLDVIFGCKNKDMGKEKKKKGVGFAR